MSLPEKMMPDGKTLPDGKKTQNLAPAEVWLGPSLNLEIVPIHIHPQPGAWRWLDPKPKNIQGGAQFYVQ